MGEDGADAVANKKKPHRQRLAGRKAERKKSKKVGVVGHQTDKQRNPKAFAINNVIHAERQFRRKQDLTTKKQHIPVVDRTPIEPPPVVVGIVGPPKCGKSTLIHDLVKHFTKTPLANIQGPVTVVAGKKQRLTFIECPNDIHSMIDMAKVADLVLLMVDAAFGFEMEVFEFLNICQVHGMPRILGVLTHLDLLKNPKALKKTKKTLKHRFWTEVYSGAKLFYLSGILHDEYLNNDVKNLARFISVIRFRPLTWRTTHPYMLADRLEDLTPPERIRKNAKADRDVALYGYVRGVPLNPSNRVHIPGYGDLLVDNVTYLPDPCPFPEKKKRALLEKERMLYAPFSGVQGIVYDKDAVYVHVPTNQANKEKPEEEVEMVKGILGTDETVDTKRDQAELQLFSFSQPIKSADFDEGTNQERPFEEEIADDGRVRRRVLFDKNHDEGSDSESDSGLEDDDSEDEDVPTPSSKISKNSDDDTPKPKKQKGEKEGAVKRKIRAALEENSAKKQSSSDEESEEETIVKGDIRWKENLAQKAADAFLERQNNSQNLWKLVYGGYKKSWEVVQEEEPESQEEIGGIFKVVSENHKRKAEEKERLDEYDTSAYPVARLRDFTLLDNKSLIQDCFVTGKWSSDTDAATLLALDDLDDTQGDFEDLETGEKHVAEKPAVPEEEKNYKENRAAMIEKKKKLKQKFDAEYDDQDNAYHDELKQSATQQAQLNKEELEGLPDDIRVELEGFRPGMYVRLEIHGVVSELMDHFDPNKPLIVGGLLPGEDAVGYIQARCKKHRWHQRILKCKDPVIISLGWRRFQTLPVYTKLEDNMRLRMLKYTPEHISCHAQMYGPITPQGTGCLAVQVVENQPGFRIAMTGSVVEISKTTTIVKKLKLVGTPLKIFRKTAFIKGMFNTVLEVGKFEGAKIRTVSGIRGMIKKATGKPEGTFRAVFEDKIKMSDIVFCRTWAPVEVPKLYNPVTSLLGAWIGMKTVGQLKRERGIRAPAQPDSMYTPIVRTPRTFKPLKVPKRLQEALPYKIKQKTANYLTHSAKRANDRVAVVLEPHEQRVEELMTEVRTNFQHKKKETRKSARQGKMLFKKQVSLEEKEKLQRTNKAKKLIFRALSKAEKRRENRALHEFRKKR